MTMSTTTTEVILADNTPLNLKDTKEFDRQYMTIMKNLSGLVEQRKKLEAEEKRFKTALERVMEERGIKSVDNDYIRITRVAGSEDKTSIDLTALAKQEPDLYEELLADYPKVTKGRKGSIRFEVKSV